MPIRLTKAVKILMITCFAVFLVQQTGDQYFGTHLMSDLGLIPSYWIHDYRFWQIFTYSFLHTDVMQLFFNLLMLVFIGSELEATWGISRFLRYYFFCATSTGLIYLILRLVLQGPGMNVPLIGSSGALYGLLMAYGILFGERVMLFMMIFPMKAKHFIWVLALIQLMTSLYSPGGGGWTSLAYLSGMGTGLLYLWIQANLLAARRNWAQSKGIFGKAKKKKSKHLKLIVNNRNSFGSSDEDDSGNNPKTWH